MGLLWNKTKGMIMMGAGINAAIPLAFRQQERFRLDEKDFSQGFFNNYNIVEKDSQTIYVIKPELLISNYKDFLFEFYTLIEEDFTRETGLAFDSIPDVNNLNEFLKIFNESDRNRRTPFTCDEPYTFSVLGCRCDEYWLFYNGSYKAFLEEYSTLMHLERILAKAMNNPLANAIKFGIFG